MDSACDCDCDFTGEPQIKGGRFEVKCAEINYFPQKNSRPEMAEEQRKKSLSYIFLAHIQILL